MTLDFTPWLLNQNMDNKYGNFQRFCRTDKITLLLVMAT